MSEAFDIHECGQLRLAAAGEQTSLLPIPDRSIPASLGPCLTSEALRETTAGAVVGSRVFCGTDGLFCSVGCQVRGHHRDWALTDPWLDV